jgi:hypothetical protein
MALFNYDELKNSGFNLNESNNLGVKFIAGMENKFENLSLEDMDSAGLDNCDIYGNFDIFLSHSYQDKEIIPALKIKLEDMGYSVYVDWISDGCISRNKTIDKETASMLQKRMKQSKCLLYATSSNSKNSRWMPWELGYFDGIKNKKVAILPISKNDNNFDDNFKGEEYLGLYQYIDNTRGTLYVQENSSIYEKFKDWINN